MKRTMRKTVAVLLALAMLCSMMPAMALASWDGTTATAVTPVGDVYSVGTPEELAWVAQQVNIGNDFTGKTVELTADISLDDQAWTPIGNATNAFAGTFDGKGCEISGINVTRAGYSGLFGNSVGVIKDFTLRGAVSVSTTTDFVGAVVGFNAGTVQDVTSYVTVNAPNAYNVGGIAGLSTSGIWVDSTDTKKTVTGATGLIKRCVNDGSVTGSKKVGGIVGENAGTISQSINNAKVDGTDAGSKNGVGGIAGRNGNNNTATETGIILNCINTGDVGRAGQKWVGGMAGFNNSLGTITNCYTVGAVLSTNSNCNPIAGNQEGTATNCYSLDTISATGGTNEKEVGIRKTAAEMKDVSLVSLLGRDAFAPVENNYPALRWQLASDTSAITDVDAAGIKTDYLVGEALDTTGVQFRASYSDGTYEVVEATGVSWTTTNVTATALTAEDNGKTVSVDFTYDSHNYSTDFTLEVKQTYAVSFYDVAGAIIGEAQTITSGQYATAPAQSSASFDGWYIVDASTVTYTDQALYTKEQVDAAAVVAAVNYKAHFAATDYTLTESFTGVTAIYSAGVGEGKQIRTNTDVKFSLTANENYTVNDAVVTYAVGGAAAVTITPVEGVYTIPGELITGNVTLTVKAIPTTAFTPAYADGAWQIDDADALRWFRDTVNTAPYDFLKINATFIDDIDLSDDPAWVGIGTFNAFNERRYAGVIDGGDHTLTLAFNGTVQGGLVAYGRGMTVKNLNIAGTYTSTMNNGHGAVVGQMAGGTVENVTSTLDITNTNQHAYVGGIVGQTKDGKGILNVIKNCSVSSDISGVYQVAGIVGRSEGAAAIENCEFSGTLSAGSDDTHYYCMGGIAGTVIAQTTITGCANLSDITTGLSNAGGIVAYAAAEVTITDCYNKGNIANGATANLNGGAGGILGRSIGVAGIENCYSTGTVTANIGLGGALFGSDLSGGVSCGNSVTITNSYFLTGAATGATGPNITSAAAVKTEAELKALASTLGSAYTRDAANQNGGYPILVWQDESAPPATITGGDEITTGGSYKLAADASGTITISTTDPVTLIGNGATWDTDNVMTSTANSGLHFACGEGVNLTLKDCYINNSSDGILAFTGEGNTLKFEGMNVLDYSANAASVAAVHVPADTSLTVGGNGTLYFYKQAQGAGFGGNSGEMNGELTFENLTMFAKSTKQGALIGAGAGATGAGMPGSVTFNSGTYNLIANSRSACIGGSAGSTGASAGTVVNINGGSININVDFSGAAIGGGGYASGNDASGGTVYISGGSVRTYLDENAISSWSQTERGVYSELITAAKQNNATDKTPLYLLVVDVDAVSPNATGAAYVVGLDNNASYYSGALHSKGFVNEALTKSEQHDVNSTVSNWDALDDANLYFYVTGEDHTVTVNGEEFSYLWNDTSKSFALDPKWDGTSTEAITPEGDTYTVNTGEELAWVAAQANGSNNFAGKTVVLGTDINLNNKAWTPIGSKTTQNPLTIADQAGLDAALDTHRIIYDNTGNSYTYGSSKNIAYNSSYNYYYLTVTPFAGTFDGAGHSISGLSVNTDAGYAGLFGCVTGTVKDFSLSGTVTGSATNADYVGGVTGMLAEGGCISEVTSNVTVTANNVYNVGGIAGFVGTPVRGSSAKNTTIEKCINNGAVVGKNKVGGIAGENAGTISLCANSGTINGTNGASKNGVGGIAGRNGNNNTAIEAGTIENCYNTGVIGSSTLKWVGGITGFNNGLSKVINCYDVGAVIGTAQYNPIVGQNEGVEASQGGVYNSYYLDTLKTPGYDNGVEGSFVDTLTGHKTETELKAGAMVQVLGAAYGMDLETPINNGYPVFVWQGGGQLYTVTVPTGTGYTVTPSDGYTASVLSGGEFKFTVTMDSDYTLNYVKCGSMLTPENGVYTISNITANKTVEINFSHNVPSTGGDTTGGNPTASVWDGETIDLRWFDPAKTEFSISKPAELAGLAALVNGIYNDDIQYIYGTASYIVDKQATGTTGANNNATPEFHYGAYDFDGCTVELDSNINMGSGNNYMPIGGQYLMDPDDTTTRIDASFNGTFDGQGHTVTLYCDRWAEAYGNGQSIGLIGRLGCHDSDVANGINKLAKDCAVTDVAVKGSIKGNRSVGGIVGKIGKTDGGAIIESCANFAEITGTDAKGTGGICGAAWNGGSISNCYNAGAVSNERQNAGGIAGTCEISVVNCFNVGTVTSSENNDMAIATNNGGATFTNCYFLNTSTSLTSGVYPASGGGTGKVESKTSEEMKSADFLNLLGSEFASDTKNINNGYPVLSWQNPSAPTGSGSGGSTVEPPVTPSDKVTTTTASAAAKVTTGADGTKTGTANLTQSQVNTAINDAVKAADTEGTKAGLEIKTTGDENASEVKVALPTAAVKSAADNEKVTEFTVTTGAGSVKMDEKALSSLASQATGSTVEISIKVDTDEDALAAIQEANGLSEADVDLDTALALNVTVLSGSKKISNFNGSLTVDVPVDSTKYSAGESYKVIVIHDDNSVEVMSGVCSRVDGKLVVRTNVSRLSTFIVTEQKAISYSDVEMTSWFYDAVAYVTDKGLMNGVGDSEFGPEGTMTRAMLVTTLYRMEGSPAVTAANSFSDVAAGQWYTDAVTWASANKIVSGYGSGLFGTNDNITREQMAAILMRYSVYKNYDTAKRADLSAYTDAALISAYAVDAMEWANGEGYITGRTDTILAPAGTATRAEVSTILMRFGQSMAK